MRNNGLVRTIGGCQGGQWENSTKSSQENSHSLFLDYCHELLVNFPNNQDSRKELSIAAAAAANDDITFQVALHPSVYIAQFIF